MLKANTPRSSETQNLRKVIINAQIHSNLENIYVLGVFTEKPLSKPLERSVVYIPIIT